jgi:hypothetical protein
MGCAPFQPGNKRFSAKDAKCGAKDTKTLKPIDEPRDAVPQQRHIEIQQVTQLETAEPEIAQQLAAMHRQDLFDRFQLHNDAVLHKKVDTVSVVDRKLLVTDRNRDLPARAQTKLF